MAENRFSLDNAVRTLSSKKKREEPEYIDFEEAQKMMAGDLEDALESAENREPVSSPESLFVPLPAMNYKTEQVDDKALEDEYRTDVDIIIPQGMLDDRFGGSTDSQSDDFSDDDIDEEELDEDYEDYTNVDPFDGSDEGRPIEEEDVDVSSHAADDILSRYERDLSDDIKPRVNPLDIINQATKNMQKNVSGGVKSKQSKKGAKEEKSKQSENKSKSDGEKSKPAVKRESGEYAHLRDIPKVLIREIQSEFSSAKNQNDAVIAWIVCHGNEKLVHAVAGSLTEEQKDVIRTWQDSIEVSNERRLDVIVSRLKDLDVAVDTLEMLLSYLVLDRKGFSNERVNNPRDINMLENGVLDVIIRAEEQTKQMRNQRNIIQGRRKS